MISYFYEKLNMSIPSPEVWNGLSRGIYSNIASMNYVSNYHKGNRRYAKKSKVSLFVNVMKMVDKKNSLVLPINIICRDIDKKYKISTLVDI